MSLVTLVLQSYWARPSLRLVWLSTLVIEAAMTLALLVGAPLGVTLAPSSVHPIDAASTVIFAVMLVLQRRLASEGSSTPRARLIPGFGRGHRGAQLGLLVMRMVVHVAFLLATGCPLWTALAVSSLTAGVGMGPSWGVLVVLSLYGIPMWMNQDFSIWDDTGWMLVVFTVLGVAMCTYSVSVLPRPVWEPTPSRDGSTRPTVRSSMAPGSCTTALGHAIWLPFLVRPGYLNRSALTAGVVFIGVFHRGFSPGVVVSVGLGLLPLVTMLPMATAGYLAQSWAPVLGRRPWANAVLSGFLLQALVGWLFAGIVTGFTVAWGDSGGMDIYRQGMLLSAGGVPAAAAMGAAVALISAQRWSILTWGAVTIAGTLGMSTALRQATVGMLVALLAVSGLALMLLIRQKWRTADLDG